jgi:RTX calcium-binding nonapeptide repeat (4 copies)
VQVGDVLGMLAPQPCLSGGLPAGDEVRYFPSATEPPKGSTQTTTELLSGFRILIAANVEPDSDHDGFGDETQDQCPTNATTQGPCPAPGAVAAPPPTCKGKPATIAGTSGNDVRKGSSGKDVIAGLGGNDKLSGLAGNDLICGGAGKDTLLGQAGKDKFNGGGGKDVCKGGKGKDTASGCEIEKSILPRKGSPGGGGGTDCQGYSPCLPPGPDVDCKGGGGDGPRYVQGPVKVTGSDPYGLDGPIGPSTSGIPGVGCESG